MKLSQPNCLIRWIRDWMAMELALIQPSISSWLIIEEIKANCWVIIINCSFISSSNSKRNELIGVIPSKEIIWEIEELVKGEMNCDWWMNCWWWGSQTDCSSIQRERAWFSWFTIYEWRGIVSFDQTSLQDSAYMIKDRRR